MVAEDHPTGKCIGWHKLTEEEYPKKKQSTKLNKRLKKNEQLLYKKKNMERYNVRTLAITYTLLGFACLLTIEIGIVLCTWICIMLIEELHLGTRCWKGYEKKGMKTEPEKREPNCVKKEDVGGKYSKWDHEESAEYSKHLEKTFGPVTK